MPIDSDNNQDAKVKSREFPKPFVLEKYFWAGSVLLRLLFSAVLLPLIFVVSFFSNLVHAEGWFQVGEFQNLGESGAVTDNNLHVDIINAGEWINVAACGEADTNVLTVEVLDPTGTPLAAPFTLTASEGLVSCTDPMNAPITNAYKIQTAVTGQHEVRIVNVTASYLNRYDITVTQSNSVNPDPTGATGITGRLSNKKWFYNAGAFNETTAADTNYYVLTPGGFPNTNYVWLLDLNNFAGYVYEITANGIGVNPPRAGFTTPRAGNTVDPEFDIYLNFPAVAGPRPSSPPTVSGFSFVDDAGQDLKFSPGIIDGIQDSGNFQFTTNTSNASYAIAIDIDQDGVFGNAGDVWLIGPTVNGLNTVAWDGTDITGTVVPTGNYSAKLSVRLGEFHFVAADAETSGGSTAAANPANGYGLTVYETDSSGAIIPTRVYWDDESVTGSDITSFEPVPIAVPFGNFSGTTNGYHTWGDFTGSAFGNEKFVDTFVYGREAHSVSAAIVADDNGPPSGSFTAVPFINAGSVGDTAALSVGDQDSIGAGTLSATVTNPRTGETENVTLTEVVNQPGNFTFSLPTASGAASDGSSSNGSINVQAGDTLTITYDDPADGLSTPRTVTASDIVGGADGSPSIVMTTAGEPATLSVTDADIAGTGTLSVTVTNQVTGEIETVSLVETGSNTGVFTGTLATSDATGTNATPALMNVQPLDQITISYQDALRSDGTSQTIQDSDTVKEGTNAFVQIDATTVGNNINLTVTDGDRANTGSLNVTVLNDDTGESETITLTEVSGNPGQFTGSVATVYGTTASGNLVDGVFNADAADVFRINYVDVQRQAGAPAVATATDAIAGGINGTASISGTLVGQPVALEVTDADLVGNGTLSVTVTNGTTGEVESVTLVETGASTGVFQANLPTSFSTSSDGNGTNGSINTANGHILTISYNDVLRSNGSTQLVTNNFTITGGVDGTTSINATTPGQIISLSVTDADLAGAGTLSVLVTNVTTGETESATLTEVGATGVFQASLASVFGTTAGANNDSSLVVQASDTVRIDYVDAIRANGSANQTISATDTVAGGVTGVVTITGSTVGQPVSLSVNDTDLSGNGTLQVTVTNTTTSEIETVTLNESGTTPGLFEASLPTAFGATSDGNGTNNSINVTAGHTLQLDYNDQLIANGSTQTTSDVYIPTGGVDGTASINAPAVGQAIALEVNDADLSGSGTLSVVVTNITSGEVETVTLVETGPATGIFQAGLSSTFAITAGADNSGDMNIKASDTIQIDYVDAFRADGGTNQTVSATDTVSGGNPATVGITATLVGQPVSLQVDDYDLAGDGSAVVQITNLDTGETENVTLSETGANTGVFTGSLPTTFGTVSDGDSNNASMNADTADVVQITYVDTNTVGGGTQNVTATTSINGGATGVPSISGTSVGQPLNLQVSDSDIAGAGTISVTVTNGTTGEIETVTLTETGASTGIFQSSLLTVFGTVSDGNGANGSINLSASDVLTLTYTDTFRTNGSSGNETTNTSLGGGTDGAVQITGSSVGQPVTITVNDLDLAGNGSLTVTVTNPATGEVETVTLTESGTSPGVFTGTLSTTHGASSDGNSANGSINVVAGQPLQVEYSDQFRADGGTQTLSNTYAPLGGVSGTAGITAGPVGQAINLTVTDADLAGDGSVSVTVTNIDTGEIETVVLAEVSGTPGTFNGTLATSYLVGTGTDNDSTLNGDSGDVVQITYSDVLIETGATNSATTTDTMSGGVDAVVGITATIPGAPVGITLNDTDLSGSGSVIVTVTNQTSGEVEQVTLTEISGTPGAFSAPLPNTFNVNPGADNTGNMNLQAGDLLEVSFLDPFGANGGSITATNTVSVLGGTDAVVTVPSVNVGVSIPVTVVDPDLAGSGTITVVVDNTTTGEAETLVLVEVIGTPGTFEGSIDTTPSPFNSTSQNGVLSVSPNDTVTVSFDDPLGDNGGLTTTVGVMTPPNRSPVAIDDTISTPPNNQVSIPVLLNDSDPDGTPLSIASVTQPSAGGTVTFTSIGTLVFTPTSGFTGPVTFTYTMSDPQGQTATASVTVNIDGQAPTAVADVVSTQPNSPVSIAVLTNDVEPGFDPINVQSQTTPANGSITLLNNVFTYTPNSGFTGIDTFTYTIVNSSGLTDTATVQIVVDAAVPDVADDTSTTAAGMPTTISVLANDTNPGSGSLSITNVTQPANGTVTLNPDNTIAYVPNAGYYGTETITYTACNDNGGCSTGTVTITVTPPVANVTGMVFEDPDHNRIKTSGEAAQQGWLVQLLLNGNVVGSDTTAADGTYAINGLVPRSGYQVKFVHPDTGIVWDMIDNITLPVGTTVVDQNLPIDPSGVVYEIGSRNPVSGIRVVMTDVAGTALPGNCFVDPTQQNQITGNDGFYRFDLSPQGAGSVCPPTETEYRISIFDSAGSQIPAPANFAAETNPLNPTGNPSPFAVQIQATAPAVGAPTTYYLRFLLQAGDPDVVNNHIPVQLVASTNVIADKRASKRLVSAGELVPYTITISNGSAFARTGLNIVDLLPTGLVYRSGTAIINSVATEPTITGNQLNWQNLSVPANGQLVLQYMAVTGTRLKHGKYTNRAYVYDPATLSQISNTATATVEFAADPDFDCSIIIGRVFDDMNGNGKLDTGEPGLKGVRIATINGLLMKTGKNGRYHLPCAAVPNSNIGSNFVLKIDEQTIPQGYQLTSRNPQMVRLTRGKMTKVNFAVQQLSEIVIDVSNTAFAANSTKLKPQYRDAIGELINDLEASPGELQLVYHASAIDKSLAKKRLRQLSKTIEQAWVAQGSPYDLSIERSIEVQK